MTMKFNELYKINNIELSKKYIESLSYEQREALIEPLFNLIRSNPFPYQDDEEKIKKSFTKLSEYTPDTSVIEMFNNSSMATDICRYFCADKFYATTEPGKKNIFELYQDDKLMKKMIKNRLGMDWFVETTKKGITLPPVNEAFNLTPNMILRSFRSTRQVVQTSIFHPDVAKMLTCKYSNENDTILDYSAGWGARMLGALTSNRKYIGIDPHTIPELQKMADYFGLNPKLIQSGSESVENEENSVDFCYSSPPYLTNGKATEEYSRDPSQAYNKGLDYFYDTYWANTLKMCKSALKPNKYFGLNIFEKEKKMIDMAKAEFGEPVEIFQLRLVKSHLSGKSKDKNNSIKYEPVFIFKNIKF